MNLGYAKDLRPALVKLQVRETAEIKTQTVYTRVVPCHNGCCFCCGFLQEENLSAMNTDPLYSAYHYSHPPLVERLRAIDGEDKKTD